MNDTIPTPRTEEVVINFDHWSELADFARQLERELTTSRELCQQYKEVAEELGEWLISLAVVLGIAYFIFTDYQPFMDALK